MNLYCAQHRAQCTECSMTTEFQPFPNLEHFCDNALPLPTPPLTTYQHLLQLDGGHAPHTLIADLHNLVTHLQQALLVYQSSMENASYHNLSIHHLEGNTLRNEGVESTLCCRGS